jgi:hypothetical protein
MEVTLRDGQPLLGNPPEEAERQAEAPIVLGAFWTVLPLQTAHPGWADLYRRTHFAPPSRWYKRSEQPSPSAYFMRNHENPKRKHRESQGTPDSREASWRTAIQAAYAWLKGK